MSQIRNLLMGLGIVLLTIFVSQGFGFSTYSRFGFSVRSISSSTPQIFPRSRARFLRSQNLQVGCSLSEKVKSEFVPFYEQVGQSDWSRCDEVLNIILVGNPMVGKTTLANIVSRKFNMTLVDVDDYVHVIGRFAPDDAHARVLESILNREHYTTRGSLGGLVVACGGYMINRQDVVSVLQRAKREGHIIVHLQRRRFWQSESNRSYFGWPFLDLSNVPFSSSKSGQPLKVLSSKTFTPEKLAQLTEKIYANRPAEKELKTGAFTPYIPRRIFTSSPNFVGDAGGGGVDGGNLSLADTGAKTRAWLAQQMESEALREQIEALYRKARSHQFYAIFDETRSQAGNAELSARDFLCFMHRLARQPRFRPGLGGLVASITSKSVAELLVRRGPGGPGGPSRLEEVVAGAEVVELRVDMLAAAAYGSRDFLKAQYGLLRRHCPVPVLWTVRSRGQGGEFGGGALEYMQLVKLGAELGAELVDVEACWPPPVRLSLMRSARHATVVSSLTFPRPRPWTAAQLAATLDAMARACEGRSRVVKLVVEATGAGQVPSPRARASL